MKEYRLKINGGFSLLGLIVATILIVPLLTNLLSAGMERLYGGIFGNEGRLAARNMRDNKNIIQNITLLFISISAVIAITVVGDFVTTYVSDVFNGAELEAFLQPMHSMTYFILLLATVGIINNLLINYIQKRRTIATFVSYMEIQTIFLVAGPKISTVPELDAGVFLSAGVMGIVVTLIGSVVPIFKSRQMKLVEEIKFE